MQDEVRSLCLRGLFVEGFEGRGGVGWGIRPEVGPTRMRPPARSAPFFGGQGILRRSCLLCLLATVGLYAILLTSYNLTRYSRSIHLRSAGRDRHNELEQIVTKEIVSRLLSRVKVLRPEVERCKDTKTLVHLAFIVVGETYKFLTALKALLLSRKSTSCTFFVLHVLADQPTFLRLRNSSVLKLKTEPYNPEAAAAAVFGDRAESRLVGYMYKVESYTSLLPATLVRQNLHYSGVPAMLKLMYDRILPPNVEKAIALDLDVLVLNDLVELWQHDAKWEEGSFFAMVEEQSEWYANPLLTKTSWLGGANDFHNSYRWPHLGRGFNTGVILMNLKRMREAKEAWKSLWTRSYQAVLLQHPRWKLQLGDQDVFNACINDHPAIVTTLPCGWNLQDAGLKTSALMCTPRSSWSIVHFNFFAKRRSFWSGLLRSFYNYRAV